MEDAKLYQKHNSLQRRDALDCLEEFSPKIQWRFNGDRVLDIGCGDGGVTAEVLQLFLPLNNKIFVGCDLSEKMIKYAQEHHENEKIKFVVFDVAADFLPANMKSSFDHIFSFYTLHWVHEQKKAFENMFKILDEGGDCLLIFLGNMPIYDVFRHMAKNPKWSSILENVESFVSPYHDSKEPEKDVKKLMEEVGFKQIDVICRKKSVLYHSIDEVKKAVQAVNPFNIPENLKEAFMNNYIEIVKEANMIHNVNKNKVVIKASYTLIVAYGRK